MKLIELLVKKVSLDTLKDLVERGYKYIAQDNSATNGKKVFIYQEEPAFDTTSGRVWLYNGGAYVTILEPDFACEDYASACIHVDELRELLTTNIVKTVYVKRNHASSLMPTADHISSLVLLAEGNDKYFVRSGDIEYCVDKEDYVILENQDAAELAVKGSMSYAAACNIISIITEMGYTK